MRALYRAVFLSAIVFSVISISGPAAACEDGADCGAEASGLRMAELSQQKPAPCALSDGTKCYSAKAVERALDTILCESAFEAGPCRLKAQAMAGAPSATQGPMSSPDAPADAGSAYEAVEDDGFYDFEDEDGC